jgi:putative nucleotidyltransferase with HDIG domain
VIGILSVYSDEVNAFTVDDKDLLTETSRDISFALDRMTMESARKLAEEKIHQQVERLTALTAIDQAISSSFDLQISLSILLFHGAKQLKADAVAVLLLNPNLNMLEYYIGRGFHTDDFEKGTVSLRDEGAGRAALNRQMVSVPDLSNHYPEFSRSKLLEAESFVAYYGVPLIAKGKIKGVLEVFHRAPLNPNREWLDFLNTLAGQAAIAVDNYQLFDGLQKSNADLRRAYDTTIEGWSHALDLRDKETEGHTQRVVEMTMKLADAAGMTEEEMVHVRRGALLHDIGKMGIPDSILLKSGELTDDEKEIMHRHPTLAFEMLSRIDYLRPALDIPYCHHEKWDGTGYPRGLIGEQIPLAARLFAIVDVWDALRSDRSYRKSWSKEKVFEHIRSLSGAYFDPHVVELFFDEFSEQT